MWPQSRLVAQAQSLRDRKIRPGEHEERAAAAAQRAEINRKWVSEKLLNGKNEAPAIPPYLRVQLG